MQKLRGGSITPIAVDYIAEQSDFETTVQLTPLRRGYLYFDQTRLAQTEPLGLFQAQKTFDNKDKLLVLPKLFKTPRLNLQGKRTCHHGGINNASIVGDSQEFISLRDYHPGDPIRSIHWRSFAKLNKPVVKEYTDEYFTRYGLILDTYLDKKSELIFEDAVSIAASFMTAQKEQDALLDLMFVGNNTYRFTTSRGLAGADNILEILACIEPVLDSNIKRMELMIKEAVHECSALNIPIKFLLIIESNDTNSADALQENDIHVIKHDSLQHDLDTVWTA